MSRKDRFQAKDKKVHKMSRDGLVEQNLSTGEESRISQRGQDFNLQQGQIPRQDMAGGKTSAPVNNRHARQHPQSEPPNRIEPPSQSGGQAPDYRQDIPDTPQQFPSQPQNYRQDAQAPASGNSSSSSRYDHSGAPNNTEPRKQQRRQTPQTQSETDSPRQFEDNAPKAAQPDTGQPYPMPENVQNEPQNEMPRPYERGPDKPPSKPLSSRYRAKKPINTHHDTTDAAAYEHTGRLRFSEEQPQAPTGAKPRQTASVRQAASARQHGTKYQQQFTTDAAKPDKPPVSGDTTPDAPAPDSAKPDKPPTRDASQPSKPGRLQFSKDEKPPDTPPDKKLSKLGEKAAQADAKLEKARDKLPAKKKARQQLVYDEQKGKVKKKLQFEKEILPPGLQKPLTPAPVAAVQRGTGGIARVGANKLHQKVSEGCCLRCYSAGL